MTDNYSKDGPTHGQWDNTNDEKAAHGGLRHSTVKGSIGKTAPPHHDLDPSLMHSTKAQGQRNKTPADPYGRTTNTAYERSMRLDGRDKFHDRWTRATDVTEQAPEFRQLQEALPKVAEGLRADIEEARASKGRRPEWLKSLVHLDPYSLAYIGLHTCYNAVLSGQTLASVTQEVGKLIDKECLKFDLLEGPDEKTNRDNKRIIEMVSKTHSSAAVRLKSLRNIATKNGVKSLYFGIAKDKSERRQHHRRRVSSSGPILSAVMQHCEIFEKTTVMTKANMSKTTLSFTPEAEAALEKSAAYLEWMEPLLKPMAMALPNPWTDFHTGCYDDPFLASGVKLVRKATRAQEESIQHQFTKGEPEYVRALNALQATPMSINEPILEAVQWCWDERKQFGKFPAQDLPEFPRLPEDHESMDRELKAAIKEDQRDFRKTVKQVKGAAAVMRQDLQTAHELAVHEWFGMPWNLDWRGRFYMVPSFTYHRDDHIKSLFMFQRGYKVEGNNAFWLKVHLANVGDFEKTSKMPLQARADWVDANSDWILEIAKDYRSHFEKWTAADKPFQFLAAAFEYIRYIEQGTEFVGYLPYSLDGTNSGVQHYSAASRSLEEGALTNLVPAAEMADIYQAVANKVTAALQVFSGDHRPYSDKYPDGPTNADLAKVWLEFGIDRSVQKRSVMTFPYSSKAVGMAGQFIEDLMKPLQRKVSYGELSEHPIARTEKERFVAARFLANVSYEAIVLTLPSAAAGMEWLRATEKVLSKQNKPIRWTTPSGFPVVQSYQKKDQLQTQMFLFDRTAGHRSRQKVTLAIETGKMDVRKSGLGVAANFTHSNDAAAMALCICDLIDTDGAEDFFMIHDSFAISGDVWDLYHSVRRSFVNMYTDRCVFFDFQEDLRRDLNHPRDFEKPENGVPPIPPKGTLDLEAIKDSEFCFS